MLLLIRPRRVRLLSKDLLMHFWLRICLERLSSMLPCSAAPTEGSRRCGLAAWSGAARNPWAICWDKPRLGSMLPWTAAATGGSRRCGIVHEIGSASSAAGIRSEKLRLGSMLQSSAAPTGGRRLCSKSQNAC